jgi:hypothetical protein
MVYVKGEDKKTGVGAAVIERAMSAWAAASTSTVVMLVLLLGTGSVVCEVTVAELRMVVPYVVPAFTLRVNWMGSAEVLAPLARAGV